MTTVGTVQQCRVGSFYQRNGRWISNRQLPNEKDLKPDQTIRFGSAEYFKLVWELVDEHRQESLALDGDVMIERNGKNILIQFPEPESDQPDSK